MSTLKEKMKLLFFAGLLFSTCTVFSQATELKTSVYAGTYSAGDVEEGARGRVIIYPETDSTVLFFIDICRGGSASIGQLYGRLIVKNAQGVYYSKKQPDKKGCKWKMAMDNNNLTIKTLNECIECGFGHGIVADNQYKRKFNMVPGYFTDSEGRKVYFDKTKPENYLK
jgi:hypothetical protein